jgi:hypothetical protein
MDDQDNTAVLATALLGAAGLPFAAVDALWRSGAATGWKPGRPGLAAPSSPLTATLIASPTGTPGLGALAASIWDPQQLHDLVTNHHDDLVWRTAAANLSLAPATSDMMAAYPLGVTAVSTRRAARQALADAEANGDLAAAAAVAAALVDAGEAVLIAGLLADRDNGTLTGVLAAVADSAAHGIVHDASWGTANRAARLVRDRVLDLVPRDVRTALAAELAVLRGAPVTAVALRAIIDAVDDGELTLDDIEATVDAEAAAYADLVGGDAAMICARQLSAPARPSPRTPVTVKTLDRHDSASDEAAMLAIMGLASVGARTVLSSADPCTDTALANALDAADVETVIDWAEGRTKQQPKPGAVVREMSRMALTRLCELSVEVARRPAPLERCPELVSVYPAVAAVAVPPAAGRAAAKMLLLIFGDDPAAWSVFTQLVADGADETLVELAEASAAVTRASV